MIATLVLFVSLGLDTFAVALGLGMQRLPRTRWIRIGVTFALFEGVMPALGLLAGRSVAAAMGNVASYSAGAILLGLGAWEIREALVEEGTPRDEPGLARIRSILLLGLSVSLDELAVGFSLGVVGASVGLALGYIAIQAFVVTFVGLSVGARFGDKLQERAELAAGVLLMLLGAAIVGTTHWGLELM